MLIRYAEIYANTDILSPIDRETWQIIGETSKLTPASNVIELASGKGACARLLADKFGCRVEGFDSNAEFVDYSNRRAAELGQDSSVHFTLSDINKLAVKPSQHDLGVCLGALYIFREAGWRVLTEAVKPGGYLAISDLFCKKLPPPRELTEIFFEEEDEPLALHDVRRWYTDRGLEILREVVCSRKAWLEYYDLTKSMSEEISKKYPLDKERQMEIAKELREDQLVREYGEEYIGYMTFIMRKP